MPSTVPGSDRSSLGFSDAARLQFSFLEPLGMLLVEAGSTFVRYESGVRFVNIFHGRSSYEIGVEVGRWVDVGGEVVEEKFPLAYLAALRPGEVGSEVRGLTALSSDQVVRFMAEVGGWARTLLPAAVAKSSDRLFSELQAEVVHESQSFLQEKRAAVLRERAASAWRDRDFGRVVLAYSEILDDLPFVLLRPSELKRLQYAESRLGGVA